MNVNMCNPAAKPVMIYLAGPYRPYIIGSGCTVPTTVNILKAEETAVSVVDQLYVHKMFPVTPHLNTANFEYKTEGEIPDEYWLECTMELMRRCDAVLLIGEDAMRSSGTRAEVEEAKRLNIPVFNNLDHLVSSLQTHQTIEGERTVIITHPTI
ncbi:hypothetical protein CVQ90_20370 [Salmonella enterica subsp. enterica serovar Bareilly]|nr:hypothetical protein [Salmonella enterica]EEN0389518.1 hypothetical protein [Salmonella enterica subsp. enterica serovar Bareilly]